MSAAPAAPALAETVRQVLGQERTNAENQFETVGEPFAQFLMLLSFLSHMPEAVTVALVTRVDPPLPLARLRGLGEVTSIRARDLRFTQEEAADFLNLTMGLGLPNASVAALTRRTEGWITGL